jgi:DNA polymerase III alpha subunit
MLVSAIRPSFNSWRDLFISRSDYSTGSDKLDNVLKSTNHFILFQENLMQYFDWLGITPAESIGIIKKISKKKIKQEDFDKLEITLNDNWIKQTGSIDMFHDTWDMIQSCIAYGFCSAHGYCTAIDSLYGAYLKANYPLEYYTVILNEYQNDTDKTGRIIDEMKYFNIELHPIQFGKSTNVYACDKETNIIYKSISSIKYCNAQIADELMELSKNKYLSFIDLLTDIKNKTSVNSRQLDILIGLNFFSEFGCNKYLMQITKLYNSLYNIKQVKQKDLDKLGLSEYIMAKYAGKKTDKLYKEIDNVGLLNEMCKSIEKADVYS